MLKDSCADERTTATARARAPRDAGDPAWHEQLLSDLKARQGKTPEFEMTVERPEASFTSFCWAGSVEKTGPGVFRVQARDCVPPDRLNVAFFGPWSSLQ